MSAVESYIQKLPTGQHQQFLRIRGLVKQLVPDAEETISYGIPTWKYKGKYVLYFAAFKDHMSIYPAISDLGPDLNARMEKYRAGKGTLHFTEDDPIPDDIVEAMVKHRLAVIND